MKHRNLGKFLVAAASISMAVSPITALARENAPIAFEDEAAVDTKALLNQAIKYAEDEYAKVDERHVVAKVKNNLKAKIDAAKAVGNDVDDINAAWSALVDAVHYLDFVGDVTALNTAIDTVKDYKAEDYESGWDAFATALTKAQATAEDVNALQAEIDADKKALEDAVAGLKAKTPEVVNKDALEASIAAAKAKEEAKYTADSWKAMQDALKAAEDVKADEDATQDEVDGAKTAIEAALKGLKKVEEAPKVDKTKLDEALKANAELVKTAPKGDATLNPATYDVLKTKVADGQKVFDNKDATQTQVDEATKAIKDAYADLDQLVYRVYNKNDGEHLFTTNAEEYEALGKLGWAQEGVAWIAPKADLPSASIMTRMYDKNRGEHHYTKDKAEIAALEKAGWNNEGEKWASAKNEKPYTGVTIHRLYNPNETRAGAHHYTLADDEKDALVKLGWKWENNDSALIYAKSAKK